MKKITMFFACLMFLGNIHAQTLAFPGAEGFGRFAKGARASTSPTIYRVTNLNDSGSGSLRDAISQPNRIIVFDVAGVIKINSRLVFSSNLTVAGQTAPGDGITVYGNGVSFSGAKDVIVRHMRFRMGTKGDSGKDAAGIANGSEMIFDHCSFAWGLDETFSISWDNKGTEPGNITIQNSIIGQGIMAHSAGGLIQTNGGVTLYKNLYIDNKTRNPKVKGLNQYVNNVVYNWGSGGGYILGDTEGSSWATIENNYIIKGPSTGGTDAFVRANQYFQLFQKDNYLDYSTDGVLNGRLAVQDDFGPAGFVADYNSFNGSPKVHPGISNVLSAEQAYQWIVDSVGACIPARDEVDKYKINELKSLGTLGTLINGEADLGLINGVGLVFSALKQLDSDGDGIPDVWEDANGLNKNLASDALLLHESGYLNIERYINSIKSGIPFVKYPTQISVKGIDCDFIFLKWKNNAEESTSVVLQISNDGESYNDLVTLSPTVEEYKAEGLNSSTAYFFRLKTVNGELESVYSAAFKSTTLGVASAPALCSEPFPAHEAMISEYLQVNLRWTNVTGNWGGTLTYNVFLGTSPENMVQIATNITASNLNTTIQANTAYYWRVDAKNLLGDSTGEVWNFTSGMKPEREKAAYWAFDEETGTVAENGVYGYATAKNFTPQWSDGKVNNAVTLPASPTNAHFVQNHYDAISLGNESFSVEMWFKSAGGNVDWYLIHKGSHVKNTSTGTTGKWFGIQYNKTGSNNRLTWAIDDDVVKSDVNVTPGADFFNNQWHHLVAIRDVEEKLLKIYLNGVLKTTKADGTGNIAQTEDIVIGNTNVNFVNAFGGQIDEVAIYKGALTGEEILDNYQRGLNTGVRSVTKIQDMDVYPNPFVNELNINSPFFVDGAAVVEFFALSGQKVHAETVVVINNSIQLRNLDMISAGAYICVVRDEVNQISSFRVIK